jgi:2,4-dienoyl-CoA reductase-like NADH-dependent reductase (Old Yellow Enzyme family)
MSLLLSPWEVRGVRLRNRVIVAPMCQYSSVDGMPAPWHLVHLGQFASGGAGLIISEAAAVTADGRISPADLGVWSEEQIEALAPIVDFVHSQGAAFGVQLAHAGRKASTYPPGRGHGSVPASDGGWTTVGPSAVAFADYAPPVAATDVDHEHIRDAFATAAARLTAIGVDVIEVHAAHGYLLHEYLSPLSNQRTDGYGGSLEARMRFPLDVITGVRDAVDASRPVLVRVSATDHVPGGWDVDQTVTFAAECAARGIDAIDVSSGGLDPRQQITPTAGYQVPYARAIRDGANIPTVAVGLITSGAQAEAVLADGHADAIAIGRAMLRDPHWANRAATELGEAGSWPIQYERGRP